MENLLLLYRTLRAKEQVGLEKPRGCFLDKLGFMLMSSQPWRGLKLATSLLSPLGPIPGGLQSLGIVWSSSLGLRIKILILVAATTTDTMAMCLGGTELALNFKSLAHEAHVLSGAQACMDEPTAPGDSGKPPTTPELT